MATASSSGTPLPRSRAARRRCRIVSDFNKYAVSRSEANVAGRNFVTELTENAGAKVRVNAAGNKFAERPGTEPSLPPVLFGSLIDSVPNGGNAAPPRRSRAYEEATFAGASLNGSRAAAGKVLTGELNHVSGGLVKCIFGGGSIRLGKELSPGFRRAAALAVNETGCAQREVLKNYCGVKTSQDSEGLVNGFVNEKLYDGLPVVFSSTVNGQPQTQRLFPGNAIVDSYNKSVSFGIVVPFDLKWGGGK